jgi:uncharacterized protein
MDNTKNYALITGATSGIGLELAKIFASEGYNLVLVARTEADLDLVAAGLAGYNVDVTTIAKDLFNPKAASEIYNEVNEKTLKVTVLVNNAGQGEYGLFENTDPLLRVLCPDHGNPCIMEQRLLSSRGQKRSEGKSKIKVLL